MFFRRHLLKYGKPCLFLCLVIFSLDVIFMAFNKPSFMKTFLNGFKHEIHLRVIVLTYNRPESLTRCLTSLGNAKYGGDNVIIDIWIDRLKESEQIHHDTYIAAKKFHFRHGEVKVHNHSSHVGVFGQWLKTWNVKKSGNEIAIFLEDDITVSKYFYKWLKAVHKKYDKYPNVNGYSTQGISIRHSGDPGFLQAPPDKVCFLYPVLGTWGFSPNRQNWIHFMKWYTQIAKDTAFQPLVPGILPSKWYSNFIKRGKTEKMWSMFHIYYAWKNMEYTLYPNFPGRQGLTINWKEKGLNFKQKEKKKDPLLEKWNSNYVNLPDRPVVLDYSGAVVIP